MRRNPETAWHDAEHSRTKAELDELLIPAGTVEVTGWGREDIRVPAFDVADPLRGYYLAGKQAEQETTRGFSGAYDERWHVNDFKWLRSQYQRAVQGKMPEVGLDTLTGGPVVQVAHFSPSRPETIYHWSPTRRAIRLPTDREGRRQAILMYFRGMLDTQIDSLRKLGYSDKEIAEL